MKYIILFIVILLNINLYSNSKITVKVPEKYNYTITLDDENNDKIDIIKNNNKYQGIVESLQNCRINIEYKDSTNFYSFYSEPDALFILDLTNDSLFINIDRRKQIRGMNMKYAKSQIKAGVIYISNFFIWPIAYWHKDKLRKKGKGFLWNFLNNKLGDNYSITNEPNDYGDEYFYDKYYKGDSGWNMFWLGFRWNTRNPW